MPCIIKLQVHDGLHIPCSRARGPGSKLCCLQEDPQVHFELVGSEVAVIGGVYQQELGALQVQVLGNGFVGKPLWQQHFTSSGG